MTRNIIPAVAGTLMIAIAMVGAVAWFAFRIYVPEDRCCILIRKTGDRLPADQLVATEPGQRGIHRDVLGPGRYFRNPYDWDHELVPLTTIPAGDPATWEWVHPREERHREAARAGRFTFKGVFPMVGVVTRKIGKPPAPGQVIVSRESGIKGILREVLTPGTYKINTKIYDVELHPAIVIPAGFVGVVTNLFGDEDVSAAAVPGPDGRTEAPGEAVASTSDAGGAGPNLDDEPEAAYATKVRPLANPGERGTLRDVLQPGVYFINPKLQKVTLIEIGYNEYSQIKLSETENYRISFPSDTGYSIRVGVTVIWGIHPNHAAEIINEFGNVDRVLTKVIGPQLRSICRNIGSTYSARDFIQGEKRELFQLDMTAELQRIANQKNIEILIALVRQIEVHAPSTGLGEGEVTDDLKRTIQQSHIAIESELTKNKQREAAAVKAQLEEERKKVEIARETILADTRVMVANIAADAEKTAAETDAQAQLEVAGIQEQVAKLAAQRTEILGQASADVERMKNDAEAQGYELLVGAFGSARAYNLYTFAEGFKPESIRLFFAGEGTFWTDLTALQDAGAAKLLDRTVRHDTGGR